MIKRIISIILTVMLFALTLTACKDPGENPIIPIDPPPVPDIVYDEIDISSYNKFTQLNVSGVDAVGRELKNAWDYKQGDDRHVGMFYFTTNGYSGMDEIYNITEIMQRDPNEIFNRDNPKYTPVGTSHFWGEPLFGYYKSSDPWVVNKHVEMLTMADIDFIMLDVTNAVLYTEVYHELFIALEKYQEQGWDIPKIAFMAHSGSKDTIWLLYDLYYSDVAVARHPSLWFEPNGKPLIVGSKYAFDMQADAKIFEFFDFRNVQWPDKPNMPNNFPWISFDHNQPYNNGVVSVSVAQHTSLKMSRKENGNRGRGYSKEKLENVKELANKGQNYQDQWDTVFRLEGFDRKVDITFLTGWNEWSAIKFDDGEVHFVDLFDQEYSRDIEPMKGGHNDNFYMQTIINTRKQKTKELNIKPKDDATKTLNDFDKWNTYEYLDFSGDAIPRDFVGANNKIKYTDKSNRNDITMVQTAQDKDNIYFKVDTKDKITAYSKGENWMNILFGLGGEGEKIGDFQYIINRAPEQNKTSLHKYVGNGAYELVGKVDYKIQDNKMIVIVPKQLLKQQGQKLNYLFKASDNISDVSDIMSYYTSGDSAPIGRLAFKSN